MDLWVVAAAAGAGCLAKYWQKTLKKDGGQSKQAILNHNDEKSESVKSFDQKVGQKRTESGAYLFRRSVQKQVAEGFSSDADERHPEVFGTGILLEEKYPSHRADRDKLTSPEGYVGNNSSLLSLQPWIFRKESYQVDGEEKREIGEHPHKCDDDTGQYANAFQSHLSRRNIGPVYGFRGSKRSLRSRRIHKYSVKSLSSTENCLIPQLYRDNIDFEEYVFGPFPSPSSPSVRPFLVTDGNQIISKSSFESFNKQFDSRLHQQVDSRLDEAAIGIPPLQASRKPKRKCEEAGHGRRGTNDSQHCAKTSQLPELVERVIFFCLGLSIGVMSSVVTNKREVEKLNDLLMHSENLVQDLQDELEMKNSLVVKELANEACEDQAHQNYFPDIGGQVHLPPKDASKFSSPTWQQDKQTPPSFSRVDENKESLSKIEAELEAELERLELNMNSSSLDGRISALAELDPELIGNVIHGELREDILNGKSEGQTDSDGVTNGSSTTQHMANYSVSPKELRLRLHEILQAQLEERIKELETSLCCSKKQLHFMEAEETNSPGGFSSSDLPTSSNQESPILMDQGEEIDHPLCLNLSGDALDAYNEAYEEFLRMNNIEEENPSSTTNMSGRNDGDELCSSDYSLPCTQEAPMANETLMTNSKIFGGDSPWNCVASNQLSDEAFGADDIDDDEEARMLIQQIVEKTRQGSLLMNAQKMLSLWTNN
uniref:Foldase protein prsA 1 n=1 Tax=Anthurium amnicola TaxID=1678845 RepID=A0A1D1Z8T7_9ARAE